MSAVFWTTLELELGSHRNVACCCSSGWLCRPCVGTFIVLEEGNVQVCLVFRGVEVVTLFSF